MAIDPRLYLKQIEVGPMDNFVYLVGDAATRDVLLVDPAWQIDTIFRVAEEEHVNIIGAVVTHGHYDHCNGIEDLLARKDMPIYVNEKEAEFTKSLSGNTPVFGSFPESHTKKVSSGDKIKAGDVELTFLHTPGHTPGSQCFLVGNNLISGDTLFVKGCGRCDLPGGNPEQMYRSLTQKIMKLPEDTVLYPGHFYGGDSSSDLKTEKKKNPYLLCENLNTFLTMTGFSRQGL